jgi:NitT/TauT family transport system permease protein
MASAGSWSHLPATVLVLGIIILLGTGADQMVGPFVAEHQPEISLSPAALSAYTLRTVMRMVAAMAASLFFTFTYATPAAKSRRAEIDDRSRTFWACRQIMSVNANPS